MAYVLRGLGSDPTPPPTTPALVCEARGGVREEKAGDNGKGFAICEDGSWWVQPVAGEPFEPQDTPPWPISSLGVAKSEALFGGLFAAAGLYITWRIFKKQFDPVAAYYGAT